MASTADSQTYGVTVEQSTGHVTAPDLPYRPPQPRNPEKLPIALVGCGGISQSHLQAYRKGGFRVVALCDHTRAKAEKRREEFFPDAAVTTDYRDLLARTDIAIVDLTPHPQPRAALIEAALVSGKHVLSQKPFVVDLATGRRLVELANERGRRLAVNQNGRWAPHFAYLREAIRAGVIGEISSVDFTVHWDHHWILGTPFEQIVDLILYDFAIHWFDLATVFFGDRPPQKVYAAVARSLGQRAQPPFLAHAAVEFDHGQATFAFNGDCAFGREDRTTVIGKLGCLRSVGRSLTEQRVVLHTAAGEASPVLEGSWFPDGFQGAMGELLCAIEDGREPLNSAANNLRSLGLCFGALESAKREAAICLNPDGDPILD
ncbi:MAG TPA: Gfo/Idh/MocA family oxidoreductase [Chthoniobacteraceae bacterium]|jgi:predicted dehydrogenase